MATKDMRGGNYAAELQPKEIYRERRRRILERVGEGMVVMWGAGDDRGYGDVGTFRQSSSFFYLTGVELPNAVMVLRQKEGGDLLFLPPRDPNIERWTGPKYGPGEETAAELGFDEVLSTQPSEILLDARRRPVPGPCRRRAAQMHLSCFDTPRVYLTGSKLCRACRMPRPGCGEG